MRQQRSRRSNGDGQLTGLVTGFWGQSVTDYPRPTPSSPNTLSLPD
nr:hypothetical protein JVH1_0858 [Rhodococcus sp. JVH1]